MHYWATVFNTLKQRKKEKHKKRKGKQLETRINIGFNQVMFNEAGITVGGDNCCLTLQSKMKVYSKENWTGFIYFFISKSK